MTLSDYANIVCADYTHCSFFRREKKERNALTLWRQTNFPKMHRKININHPEASFRVFVFSVSSCSIVRVLSFSFPRVGDRIVRNNSMTNGTGVDINRKQLIRLSFRLFSTARLFEKFEII